MRKVDPERKIFINRFISQALKFKFLRKLLVKAAEKHVKNFVINDNQVITPYRSKEDCFILVNNLIKRIYQNYEQGIISNRYLKSFIKSFALSGQPIPSQMKSFKEKYGVKPPLFLLLSPTRACNLKCPGCYADCNQADTKTMDYGTVIRILSEKRDSWGSHFTVISGGEPFLYRNSGKSIFDVFKQFPDTLFLVYTNGTLIDQDTAARLADLGNVTPAISVEGYAEETDERRGRGIFKKIMQAMENLRVAGVLFGLSITITSNNADLFIHGFEEFCDFYMEQQGAAYAWLFQYMPIGRDHKTFSLIVPPEKRKLLFESTWQMIREKGYFLADFWNSGTVCSGCLAAGRSDGFLYIDWNGNVMPCVFNPYYVDNMHDIYKRGGHLDDVLFSSLMVKIREWQYQYYYNQAPAGEKNNVLTCCPLKDHFSNTYEILKQSNVKFSNSEAEAAFHDQQYYHDLVEYGRESRKHLDELWQKLYLVREKITHD